MTTVRSSKNNANRAEEMRQRRAGQTSRPGPMPAAVPARPSQSGRSYEHVAQARPVLVRNTTFGTPVRQRVATTNPRKQYYVPLSTPGTELRLPALPRIRSGARAVSGLIAFCAMIGILSMLFSPMFTIETAEISGLKRLSQNNIAAILNIQNLSIIELDPAALRSDLLAAFPMLESASVSVGLPNKVNIEVTERQPVAAWNYGDKSLWIDAKGVVFQPSGTPPKLLNIEADSQPPLTLSPEEQKAIQDSLAAANLVTASTDSAAPQELNTYTVLTLKNTLLKGKPDKINPVLLTTAQKLAAHLPAGTPLTYSAASGLGWKDAGGWEVYVGQDLDHYDQKIALYQSILKQLTDQGITPALISVEFLNAPYYRLEK